MKHAVLSAAAAQNTLRQPMISLKKRRAAAQEPWRRRPSGHLASVFNFEYE
jgi:hypothetical protein